MGGRVVGTFQRGVSREDRVLASKLLRAMRAGAPMEIPEPVYASKLPGDTEALRGVPAIGRGVSGAVKGSRPELDASFLVL